MANLCAGWWPIRIGRATGSFLFVMAQSDENAPLMSHFVLDRLFKRSILQWEQGIRYGWLILAKVSHWPT